MARINIERNFFLSATIFGVLAIVMFSMWAVTMIIAEIMVRKAPLCACSSDGASCKSRIIRWLRTHQRPGKVGDQPPILKSYKHRPTYADVEDAAQALIIPEVADPDPTFIFNESCYLANVSV
jgi:hypothetical protein